MSELKQRVLTAAVAVPLMFTLITVLPQRLFGLVLLLLVGVGAWEWAAFIGLESRWRKAAYAGLTLLLALAVLPGTAELGVVVPVLLAALLWWGMALILVLGYQRTGRLPGKSPLIGALSGWLVLVPAWTSLVWLHGWGEGGVQRVLLLFVIVWAADIAAYFSGRRWGRRKLADRISPGKTRAGVWGALVAGTLVCVLAFALLDGRPMLLPVAAVLGLITVAVSVLGDLVESVYKREARLKDSGGLFPGHGGMLDRIDSLTAAAPVFACGQLLIGVYL